LPINDTGEAEKKTKFNSAQPIKAPKLKLTLKSLFDYAILFENTRI